ncbi:ABC transporter ATP-binding protein [Campylobacter novaezeelandiae]|uniref:ABC transporter ATP-binding protein n=1 Tax=Campylobacter novaezeelandiae TaxID=2267891 RepID=UPI00190327A7|nr:ABC transporter ATP-binding protein [Campylobacter novaezeelandiae]MBK1964055.1 ABC transporter ATP-binding protein [Campylobacter novaezeelandiae]MBK1994014.1 ABC transporter ATP-binding protein [Campylobacter novaezeelandiae]
MALLKAVDLEFSKEKKHIIYSCSLSFESGKIYALMGHNGSGKSTLLKILAKQIKIQKGQVLIDKKDIKCFSSKDFAKKIAYLPQHLPHLYHISVKELVKMGRFSYESFIKKQNDEDIINEAMRLTNIDYMSNKDMQFLSGGEKTRAFLAMLLAQKSKFLLLDEPLAALDIAYKFDIMKLIAKISKELDIGVIIILHDINLAACYCDEIIALEEGKIIFHDNNLEFMKEKNIKRIFKIENTILKHPKKNSLVAIF